MPKTVKDQPIDRSLEGGMLHLPDAQRLNLLAEEHPTLSDLLVGDSLDLEITARITDVDEDGRHGLEIMTIKVSDKNGIREKAQSEIVNIGSLSADTLDRLFGGRNE